jgi:hypothetical protein
MSRIEEDYYYEPNFASLAGPYYDDSKRDQRFLKNVIADLERGEIEYLLVKDERNRTWVERKGMLLTKRR